MKPCPKCGCRNPDGYRFCCECHALLAAKRDAVDGMQKDSETGNAQDNLPILPIDAATPLDASAEEVYEIGRFKVMAAALATALVLYIGSGVVVRRSDNKSSPAIDKASGAGVNRALSQSGGSSPPQIRDALPNPSDAYSKQDNADEALYGPAQASKLGSKKDEGDRDRTDGKGEEGRTATSGNPGMQAAKKQEAIIYINKPVAEKNRKAPSANGRDSSSYYMRAPMLPSVAYPEAPSQPLVMIESTLEHSPEPEIRKGKPLPSADTVSGRPGYLTAAVVPGVKRRNNKPAPASVHASADKQQIAYQESVADTYIRLGQDKEAAAILERLLKRDLPADDRDRIAKKLRECGD